MIIIENYIIHYGVGHDKGGHSGRYPWGSGRKQHGKAYTKELNDLDKSSTKHLGNYMKYDAKRRTADDKAAKYLQKHYGSEKESHIKKMASLHNKAQNLKTKADEEYARSQKADGTTWKVIADAHVDGYRISSKECMRNAEKGRQYIQTLLGGPLGNAAINTYRYNKYYKDAYE